MADALTDFEIISLIDTDEYGQLYRGRPFTEEKAAGTPRISFAFVSETPEVLIRQWTHPRLFGVNARKRLEQYWHIQKKSEYLAQIIAGDCSAGRWVYEPFVCSLVNHSLFIESNSIYWRRAWHDACVGLSFLHNNYLPHGRLSASAIFFSKTGNLKIGGVFPLFTDESGQISDDKSASLASQSASSLLKSEFKRDIGNLCAIFLQKDIFENLPESDQADIKALAAGKISIAKASERVSQRFIDFQKEYQNQQKEREAQASFVKAESAKRPRKGIGFLYSLVGLLILIGALTGGKIVIDNLIAPPTVSQTTQPKYKPGRKINQQDFQRSLAEQSKKDKIVSVSEQTNKKVNQTDLLAPPVLSEKPETDIFVGKVTAVRYQEIKVFNANLQKTLTVFVDDKSKLSFADGSPITLELLKPGKELEIEYEKNPNSDAKVYGNWIKVREL